MPQALRRLLDQTHNPAAVPGPEAGFRIMDPEQDPLYVQNKSGHRKWHRVERYDTRYHNGPSFCLWGVEWHARCSRCVTNPELLYLSPEDVLRRCGLDRCAYWNEGT